MTDKLFEFVDPYEDPFVFSYFRNKRVAIVGPASTLEGTSSGENIDSYDIVCRLNHHTSIEEDTIKDYGKRRDVIFSDGSFHKTFYASLDLVKPDMICLLRDGLKDSYEGYTTLRDGYKGIHFYHCGNPFIFGWKRVVRTTLNTGMMAIILVLLARAKEVYVSGIDFYRQEQRYFAKVQDRPVTHKRFETDKRIEGFSVGIDGEHDQFKQFILLCKLQRENANLKMDKYLERLVREYDYMADELEFYKDN